jgi:hypothetical protein
MTHRWRMARYRFYKWLYKQIYGGEPVITFSYHCMCGLESVAPLPKPGTVLQFTCAACKTKHQMIWLKDYWQMNSIFNGDKVKFEPLNLPAHPREEEPLASSKD